MPGSETRGEVHDISIVVPIYNVEQYLRRCIDSLLAQTYKHLKIILVDDGSTDNSGQICDEYAKTYENITVIHKKNQGLGPARNSGLDVVDTEYVAFVDSDDWISPETYEVMYERLTSYGCDVSTCGRIIVQEGKQDKKVFCLGKEIVLTGEDAVGRFLLQKDLNMSACDKLFKTKLFNDVRFPSYYASEDIVPVYKVLSKANKVVLTGKPFYHYFFRVGSITRSSFSEKRFGTYIYSQEVAADARDKFSALAESANCFEYDALLMLWRAMRRSGYKGSEKKKIYKEIKKNYRRIFRNKKLTKKHKIYTFLILFHMDKMFDKIYASLKENE